MSFVFASSHLPEVKRPADEDEEEEEVRPMQRSGMVRAFSHLPQAVRGEPAWPRAAAPAPAPAFRPAWAVAPDSPSGHEADEGHDPEPDDDADDGHGSSASAGTGTHEPDDGRPWYLPRITAADLQPEGGGHDDPAKDNIGPVPRLSGGAGSFSRLPEHVDDAVNEHADAGSHVDFDPPETAGSDAHGAIGPVSPRGAAPPAGRSLFLTPRPMPPEYARQQTKTYGSAPARPKSLADISGSTFQQVAAKTGAQQQGARLAQSSPPARPANGTALAPQQPTQGRGPAPPAQRGGGAAVPQNSGAGTAPQTAGSASSPEAANAGEQADETGAAKQEPLYQKNKIIDSSTIPKSQRGLAVLKEFFNPEARSIDELNDSMRKALAGDKALILHVNSNGGHSGIIAIHLDENGNLVNTLYDPAGTYTGLNQNGHKGPGDVLTNVLPKNGPPYVDWSLADYIKHHASDGSMSFVPIWTNGETARNLEYPPNTMVGFCAASSGKVIQQIPEISRLGTVGSFFPNSLSNQLHGLMGRKVTIQHKP